MARRLNDIDKRLEYLDNKDHFMTIDNPPIIMISDHNQSLEDRERTFSFNSSFGVVGGEVRTVRNAGDRAALTPLRPLQKGRAPGVKRHLQFGGTIRSIEISSNNRNQAGRGGKLAAT